MTIGNKVARRNIGHLVAGIACVGLAALPLSQYSMLTITWIGSVAIMFLGFNLVFGVAGQMVFSHSFFWAVGAYVSSVLLIRGWPFVACIAIALIVSVAAAWLFANVLVQLEGFFLAIASFILPLLVPELAQLTVNYSGGSAGLENIPLPTGSTHWYLALVLLTAIFCLWLGRNLIDSPLGRSWRTTGNNEMVAQSVGIRPSRKKLSAFIASAFFAGLSGALFAPIFAIISPTDFDLTAMLSILVGSVIGGATSPMGAVVGSLLIVEVPQLLSSFAQNAALIYGLILLVALRVIPRGVVGGINDFIYHHLVLPAQDARERKEKKSKHFAWLVNGLTALADPSITNGATRDLDLSQHMYVPKVASEHGGPAVIELAGVSVRYGGVLAVDDVSFSLAQGDFKAIIGPNGAGKSTLFNAFGGFAPIASGAILIDGLDVTYRPPDVRASLGVARTFQETQDFGDLTAEESILIGGHVEAQSHSLWQSIEVLFDLPGHARREVMRHERAQELLELVGLGGLRSRRVSDFPYGDQKLLQLARAMAARPRFLLLDEPAAGLSEVDCSELGVVLNRLRDLGIGILLVEHNVPFVISMCEEVMVMDHGREIAHGSGAEILASPAVQQAYLGSAAAQGSHRSKRQAASEEDPSDLVGAQSNGDDGVVKKDDERLRNPI